MYRALKAQFRDVPDPVLTALAEQLLSFVALQSAQPRDFAALTAICAKLPGVPPGEPQARVRTELTRRKTAAGLPFTPADVDAEMRSIAALSAVAGAGKQWSDAITVSDVQGRRILLEDALIARINAGVEVAELLGLPAGAPGTTLPRSGAGGDADYFSSSGGGGTPPRAAKK